MVLNGDVFINRVVIIIHNELIGWSSIANIPWFYFSKFLHKTLARLLASINMELVIKLIFEEAKNVLLDLSSGTACVNLNSCMLR